MIDLSDFEETYTVSQVLEGAKNALNDATRTVPVYMDDGCGHPIFFTGEVEADDKYALFSYEMDEDIQKEQLLSLEKFVSLLESVDGDLICLVDYGNHLPFYFYEVNDYLDSCGIYHREERGENPLEGFDQFASCVVADW